jgi:DNA-binding ferritin-like protein
MATSTAAELVMRCFNAGTVAHIVHLQTNSFAAHKALDDFYHEIIDVADSFAEAYQGLYGVIKPYPVMPDYYSASKNYNEGIALLTELRDWIQANRKDIGKAADTDLQNLIDEICGLIDGTLYKLRFLK